MIFTEPNGVVFFDADGCLIDRLTPDILEFNEKNHRYKIRGTKQYIPSVTTILNQLSKSSLIIWSAKCAAERAVEIVEETNGEIYDFESFKKELTWAHKEVGDEGKNTGTLVHNYIDMFFSEKGVGKAYQNKVDDDFDASMCVDAFKEWYSSAKRDVAHVEKRLVEQYGLFCGTLDIVYRYDGKTILGDFKTTKRSDYNSIGVYSSYIMQMSAYALAYTQETGEVVDDIELISLGKDGTHVSTFHSDLMRDYDIPDIYEIAESFVQLAHVDSMIKKLDSAIGKRHRAYMKELNNNKEDK